MITRDEFDREMAERDRRSNEWRVAVNQDMDDMRRVLNETRDMVRANQELIKDNAGSLGALWREYFGHTSNRHGGV
jgi:hypothetical protein